VICDSENKLRRRLRRKGIEYLTVAEWQQEGEIGRHLHLALWVPRSERPDIGAMWQKSVPKGAKATWYVDEVDTPIGLAHYLVSDVKDGGVVPPPGPPRRIINASRGALIKPMNQFWKDIQRERAARRGASFARPLVYNETSPILGNGQE
jgi:hypothetical protein